MIWLNPLAWIGLLAVAGPVIAHLLARRRIQRVRFPTLRFVDVSRLTPARRRRITDWGLLAVRIGVVVAAVMALARPVFLTPARDRTVSDRLVRAVILDTSASMSTPAADGSLPLDAARQRATALAAEAQSSTLLEASRPADAIDGAAAWLATQSGRRELVVISDFQLGTVTPTDLVGLPGSLGLRFWPVETSSPGAGERTYRLGDHEVTADLALAPESSTVSWQTRRLTEDAADLRVLASASEAPAAQRVMRAARRLSHGDHGGGRVAVVFPSYADHATLLSGARTMDEPWMFDLVDALRGDPAVTEAARLTAAAEGAPPPPVLLPVVLDAAGRTLILAGSNDVDGSPHLVLFLPSGPASRIAAAVLASVPASGNTPASPLSELVPERVPTDTLREWERSSSSGEVGTEPSDESDGRWFWLAALVLLGFEAWLRRGATRDEPTEQEVPRAGLA